MLLQLHVGDVHDVHHREGERRRRLGALLLARMDEWVQNILSAMR